MKLFESLRGYRTTWLRGDVIAGLTVWAVLVPEALAYATIAGVSPVVGLYAAPPALILYAMFGSSRHLITGPMSATAALSAGAIAEVATQGSTDYVSLTAALAISAGVTALLAGIFRLGFIANLISEPVLKGFIIGLALVIIAGQLPGFFGIPKGSGDFFQKIWSVITHLGDTSGATLTVGVLSLAVVLGLRRFAPRVPGSLVAVLIGIAAVKLFNLDDHGVEIVGHIQSGLPSLGLPDASRNDYLDLIGSGVGIVLVGFAEGLGAAKTYAARDGYEIDANRELVGLGAANIGAGLAGGMVVNGSLSKTAVNGGAGAKSQVSGVVAAVITVLTLLFLTGLFESLPEATLAAVVIAAVMELVDFPALRRLYAVATRRSRLGVAARPDFVAAVAAMAGVLVFDTLPGLIIGIGCSLVLLVYRASLPRVSALGRAPGGGEWGAVARHPENQPVPGVVVLRVESALFFANSDHVRDTVRAAGQAEGVHAVVLDAETISFVDVSAADMLATLHHELSAAGVQLVMAHEIGQVADTLKRTAEPEAISVYPTIDAAVAAVSAGGTLPA